MKRILLAGLLFVVASSINTATAQTKKPISREGLINVVKAFHDAVKANDLNNVKNYYSDDYTFTGLDGKTLFKEERLRGLKEQGGSNFMGTSDLNTRMYGETAVVTGIAATKTSSGATEQSRFIQVWAFQTTRWRLVASQVTRIEQRK
ncbi:MAG TPA: nuclear transport factor 2 family protein [Pyrinomonadaceae bacterium]|nr:nuclear transport factor 2 family protein [Pyrinomonadaceae bacterium]